MSLYVHRTGAPQKDFVKQCKEIESWIPYVWDKYFDIPDEWRCFLRFGRLNEEAMAEVSVETHYRRFTVKFDCVRMFRELELGPPEVLGVIQHELLHVLVAPLALAAQALAPEASSEYLQNMEEHIVETLQRSAAYRLDFDEFKA